MWNFSSAAVFKAILCSRQTITRKMVKLASFLKADISESINKSLFWSNLIDESTDNSVTEKLILYVRYVDLDKACVQIKLLGVHPIRGHPNA